MNRVKQKHWLELVIESNVIDLDILSALFQNESNGSFLNNNKIHIFYNEKSKQIIDDQIIFLKNRFNFKWEWNIVKDEDWHLNWKANFNPVNIGSRITIVPSWDKNTLSDILIRIEPGRAFGTGHHQTTFLAIEFLEELIHNSKTVLDLGTGRGILSIASYFLGAKKVDSVEIDTDCIDNFRTNLKLNNLDDKINFFHYDVLKWKKFNYDIIVTNINRNIILKLIPSFKSIKSKIIFTGLLDTDETIVINECLKHNMKINKVKYKDEWIAMEIQSA